MTSKFDKFAQMAKRMVSAKGMAAKWRVVGKTIDPDKPWKEIAAPNTNHDVIVVIAPCDRYQFESLGWDFKSQELDGAEMCYMAPSGFDPTLKDQLLINDRAWVIENIVTYKPDGFPLLHVMLVRP